MHPNWTSARIPCYPLVNVYKKLWKITIFHGKIHDISTGPVMYTKCLVDSGMPISIAAQELLYPVPCEASYQGAEVDSQLIEDGLKWWFRLVLEWF